MHSFFVMAEGRSFHQQAEDGVGDEEQDQHEQQGKLRSHPPRLTAFLAVGLPVWVMVHNRPLEQCEEAIRR